MWGRESDPVHQRKMRRTGSHGFDLKTALNTRLVTLPLMSMAQSLCSLVRTEQVDDFIYTIALAEGVFFSRFIPSFPKPTVQYSAVKWSFPEDTVFQ